EELADKLAAASARLEELSVGADGGSLLEAEEKARAECAAAAKDLTAGRKKTARQLSEQVTSAMQKLAMEGGRFQVALEALPELTVHGQERVEFMVSAHQGIEARPLAKVASGGELSRLSLAIQTVATQAAQVPTLIFDEVDSGIGGRVAEIV